MEAFAIFGKPTADIDNHASASQAFSLAQRQAYLLLERYGILVKEWYRREPARAESGLAPWYVIFQALKRMEWRDEVRRGYFVEGLSGVQFALSHAAEILANANSGETFSGSMMLSLLDPAVPYGGGANLPLRGIDGQPLSLVRQASNHLLFVDAKAVVYAENYGARLWSVADATAQQLAASLSCLKQFLLLPDFLRPRKRIEVETWNNIAITDTPAAAWLEELGFEKEEKKMVLWPSRL
jgi:ATP-dependent Lhr-like helicase